MLSFLRSVPNLRINHKKSVEPYPCLFFERRFLQDPTNKNKQETPTPNMKCHQTEQSTYGRSAGGIYISQRAFTAFLLWVCEIFAGFPFTKTSANKRFLIIMSAHPPYDTKHIPSVDSQRKYKSSHT